jgi:hypothetical protein
MTSEAVQWLRETLPAVGTLLGALVGVAAGALVTWRVRAESRPQTHRLSAELGLQEWRASLQHAQASGKHTRLSPPVSFGQFYLDVLKLMNDDAAGSERWIRT